MRRPDRLENSGLTFKLVQGQVTDSDSQPDEEDESLFGHSGREEDQQMLGSAPVVLCIHFCAFQTLILRPLFPLKGNQSLSNRETKQGVERGRVKRGWRTMCRSKGLVIWLHANVSHDTHANFDIRTIRV